MGVQPGDANQAQCPASKEKQGPHPPPTMQNELDDHHGLLYDAEQDLKLARRGITDDGTPIDETTRHELIQEATQSLHQIF